MAEYLRCVRSRCSGFDLRVSAFNGRIKLIFFIESMEIALLLSVILPTIGLYVVLRVVNGTAIAKNVKSNFRGRRTGLGLSGTVLPRAGHSHHLIQSSSNSFITSIERDHLHTIKLSETQMNELNRTGMLTAETDTVNGHSHTVTLTV